MGVTTLSSPSVRGTAATVASGPVPRVRLPVRRIPPETYDREYFLSNTCEGADEYHTGRGLSALKARQVRHLEPRPGKAVLDLGCGRGEVLLACARAGARVAGIDYSAAAIEISRDTLEGIDA